MLQRSASILSLALLLGGCGPSLDSLPGFDAAAWRQDTRGCAGVRKAQLPALNRNREQLYKARVSVVADLLGRPDQEELQEQTQRVYYYYVQPGPQCAPGAPKGTSARCLTIRFGPLGTVTEVLYTSGPASF